MPINSISEVRRCPREGYIRLGTKKVSQKTGKEYPVEVPEFILDPRTGNPNRDKALKAQFKQLYGEKPIAIKIMFPPTEPEIFFQQWYKRYGSSTLPKCKGDGNMAICALLEFAEGLEIVDKDEMGLTRVKCLGPECPYQKDKSCHRIGALQVILPELSGIGVWQINTSSYNSIVNLNSALDWLKGLCGRYYMIPVTLVRVPTQIAYEGKKSLHYIMQIDMNVSIAQIQKAALIAPEKAMLNLPAPDEAKDELLYPKSENGNSKDQAQEIIQQPEQKQKTLDPKKMNEWQKESKAKSQHIAKTLAGCKTISDVNRLAFEAGEDIKGLMEEDRQWLDGIILQRKQEIIAAKKR